MMQHLHVSSVCMSVACTRGMAIAKQWLSSCAAWDQELLMGGSDL